METCAEVLHIVTREQVRMLTEQTPVLSPINWAINDYRPLLCFHEKPANDNIPHLPLFLTFNLPRPFSLCVFSSHMRPIFCA